MADPVGSRGSLVVLLVLEACGPLVASDLGDDDGDTTATSMGASLDATGEPPRPPEPSTGGGPTTTTTSIGTETGLLDTGEASTTIVGDSDGVETTAVGGESGSSTTSDAPPEPTVVRYQLVVDNIWTLENHPGALPDEAHFSWLGGATHDAGVSFWQVGELASPGIVQMAEIGATQILMTEVQPAIDDGHADQALEWQQWFCPVGTDVAVCGENTVEIEMHLDHPLLTLVSMLGPSPDWFVGVSGLDMHEGGAWVDSLVVDLHPYDGGTRSDMDFTMNGALQQPPLPISVITAGSGQLVGPGSLGTMTFTRIDG